MLKKTFEIINNLKDSNYIVDYAIGGSIATLFYIEPSVTYDLDVMVIVTNKNLLTPLDDIYNWASKNNYKLIKEHIMIEGIPVQFLPAYNSLIEESIHNSVIHRYQGIDVKVISPEYLVAIMIQTFRPIDRERAIRFFNTNIEINLDELKNICEKFSLMDNYNKIMSLVK